MAEYHASCGRAGTLYCAGPDRHGRLGKIEFRADRYTFVEHYEYFSAALEALGITEEVTLVIHDWGSALGFHWANKHREAVTGICYMEAIVAPIPTWDQFSKDATPVFQGFRSAAGEEMVLEKNIFVERVLPGSVLRGLTPEEMAVYRRPFANSGEDRRPTLTWPRQIPIDGEPKDVVAIAADYGVWLQTSDVRKLSSMPSRARY